MRGDLVRLDSPDPTLYCYGIIAPDRSRAIYTIATIAQSDVMLPGRLRFPGLDPNRHYRIRPVPLGQPPSGLRPPRWWQATTTQTRITRPTSSPQLGTTQRRRPRTHTPRRRTHHDRTHTRQDTPRTGHPLPRRRHRLSTGLASAGLSVRC